MICKSSASHWITVCGSTVASTSLPHLRRQLCKKRSPRSGGRKVYEQLIADEVKDVPIYANWLKDVKGVGPMMAGGLITRIDDPARFATVSKLWAYAVGKPGERRRRGGRTSYNPRLKTHCWKIATQLLKARGRYADLYYQFKDVYSRRGA